MPLKNLFCISIIFTFIFSAILSPSTLFAKKPKDLDRITFDGYYKVLAGKRHVGYAIQRYLFNEKTKTFRSIYYVRTNQMAGNQTESLLATADDRFYPRSYQFTQTVGKKIKIMDAQFNGLNMSATTGNGKQSQKVKQSFKKGTFLSIFLVPLMMSKGMSTDRRYSYAAIAEEDGRAYKGDAYIQKNMVSFKNQSVFKVSNVFKGHKFYFYVNTKGEYLGSESPSQGISTILVANPQSATQNMPVNAAHLKKLFGEIPQGQVNSFASPPPPPPKPKVSSPPKGKDS